jgi:hypothetical protein
VVVVIVVIVALLSCVIFSIIPVEKNQNYPYQAHTDRPCKFSYFFNPRKNDHK